VETDRIHQSTAAQVWRAGGMIWLVSVTLLFALLDLYFLGLAKKLPVEKSGEELQRGSSMRKWFIDILILEIAGLSISSIALLKLNHFQYIVPVDILIVSLHFIPLARIFAMPIYYFLGIIVSLIAIITMLLVPASSQIGNLITIAAIPSMCFIFFNWITIIYILRGGMKYLRKIITVQGS
jgi:hypothetical protein